VCAGIRPECHAEIVIHDKRKSGLSADDKPVAMLNCAFRTNIVQFSASADAINAQNKTNTAPVKKRPEERKERTG
jgi:isopentenyl phosphate kinase